LYEDLCSATKTDAIVREKVHAAAAAISCHVPLYNEPEKVTKCGI
jgi:hypothetical protein